MLDSSYSILCANLARHHHVKTAHSFLSSAKDMRHGSLFWGKSADSGMITFGCVD